MSKRRDAEGLRAAWLDVLGTGFDHFDELRDQGVPVSPAGIPDLEAARAAWALYGREVVSARDPRLAFAWGERMFGRPAPS